MPCLISLITYPNNEIRLRLSPPPRQYLCTDHADDQEEEAAIAAGFDSASKPNGVESQVAPCQCPDSSLDISSELETPRESSMKPGYGIECRPTRFGLYAKRKLQRVGGVLDTDVPNPSDGLFLTGTIPGGTYEAFNAVADYSAWLVQRLKAWIAKRIPNKLDFYVWERQGRGALHLHYYVYCPDATQAEYILGNFQQQWIRLLDRICIDTGIDVYRRVSGDSWSDRKEVVQAYAQRVKKSVAAYLSKYCSKSAGKHSHNGSLLHFPSRWWGCSRPLTKRLDELTKKTTIEYVSVGVARRVYEDVSATLERWSIKGYRYSDKVGYGMNHVFYYSPGEKDNVMSEIAARYVPISYSSLESANKAVTELLRCVVALEKDEKLRLHVTVNWSVKSSKIASSLGAGLPIDSFEAFALSSEIFALTSQFDHNRGYATRTSRAIASRCSAISATFNSQVLVQGLIPRELPLEDVRLTE